MTGPDVRRAEADGYRQDHRRPSMAEKEKVVEEPDGAGGMTAPAGVGYCLAVRKI